MLIEISIFTAPDLLGTHTLLHRIKTSGVKIGPLLKIPVGSEYARALIIPGFSICKCYATLNIPE